MLRLQLIAYKFRISLQFRGSSLFHNSKPKLTLRKSAYQNTLKPNSEICLDWITSLKNSVGFIFNYEYLYFFHPHL